MTNLDVRSYPLHIAAARDDLSFLQKLLAEDTLLDIDARDDLNATPLQVAAFMGHLDIVAFLMSKGADVSLQGAYEDNFSALMLATLNGHKDVVELLLKGQSPEVLDSMHTDMGLFCAIDRIFVAIEHAEKDPVSLDEAFEIFSIIEGAHAKTDHLALLPFEEDFLFFTETTLEPVSVWLEALTKYAPTKEISDRVMAEVHAINKQDSCYQTYIEAKFLLHVLPVDRSIYTITYESKDGTQQTVSTIEAPGFMHCFSTPLVSREIDAYRDSLGSQADLLNVFNDLSDIYHQANLFSREPFVYENSVLAYDLYQQGETLLFSTGWDGHAVNIILDPQTESFVVANAGQRYIETPAGAHIYKMYNPGDIDADFIFDLLNNTEQVNLEFAMKYQLALDETMYLEHPDQVYGNCAFYSHKPAIEALLYLHNIHDGLDESSAKSLAHTQYQNWETFENFHCLENYFDHNPALNLDAVMDILVDYQPSLFIYGPDEIDPAEYQRAEYLVNVIGRDQYRSDFSDHFEYFSYDLYFAKPELMNLFDSADLLSNHEPIDYYTPEHYSSFLSDDFSLEIAQAI